MSQLNPNSPSPFSTNERENGDMIIFLDLSFLKLHFGSLLWLGSASLLGFFSQKSRPLPWFFSHAYIVQFSYILCCVRGLGGAVQVFFVVCLGPIFFVSATWVLTSHFLLEVGLIWCLKNGLSIGSKIFLMAKKVWFDCLNSALIHAFSFGIDYRV